MITISTFNIQNDRLKNPQEKTQQIIKYLSDYQIDILCLQEVYSQLEKSMNIHLLEKGYHSYGNYRFSIPKIWNKINEKNPIIIKYPVTEEKTYYLPFLPSLLKRVLTKVEVKIENQFISIYNTHLDYQYEISKKRQLKKILEIIKEDKNPIILMGDFNLKTNKEIFQDFIEELKKRNINHINIHEKTWKNSKYHRAIDHIFLSSNLKVKEKILITNIPVSDHYPILLKVEVTSKKEEKNI